MTFQPVIPFGGYAGWLFLNRTIEAQQATFNASESVARDVDYFEENIGSVMSADDLVEDRRLLSVALGAFGLDEDINNKFFIHKILNDGVESRDALANRMSDVRYREFSEAFGFGQVGLPNTFKSSFGSEITERYQLVQMEQAIGAIDEDMRLAMNIERGLGEVASGATSDNGRWYNVMGDPAIRKVFEVAFGFPSSFASLDLDQQLGEFRKRSQQYFGDSEVSQFASSEKREDLVKLFMLRSELNANAASTSGASNAVLLLSS